MSADVGGETSMVVQLGGLKYVEMISICHSGLLNGTMMMSVRSVSMWLWVNTWTGGLTSLVL